MRINAGDVFAISLNFSFTKKKNLNNLNIEDKFCLGQIVQFEDKDARIVLYDKIFDKNILIDYTIETIIQEHVFYMALTTVNLLENKKWPVIKNLPLSQNTPMQAYREQSLVENHNDKYVVLDYNGNYPKEVDYETVKNIPIWGTSVTPGWVEEEAQYHLGFIENHFFYNYRVEEPSYKALIWDIYPEIYKNAWEKLTD